MMMETTDLFLLYFVFTGHVSLLCNISQWQTKHRGDQLIFWLASTLAAVLAVFTTQIFATEPLLVKHEVGMLVALVSSMGLTFAIPRLCFQK